MPKIPGGGRRNSNVFRGLIVGRGSVHSSTTLIAEVDNDNGKGNGPYRYLTDVFGRLHGVSAGKYVLVFGEFRYNKKRGYEGPDQLQNLYNDPDKNAGVTDFNIVQKARQDALRFQFENRGVEPDTPGPMPSPKFQRLDRLGIDGGPR